MKLLDTRQERSEGQNQWAVPFTLQLHKISDKNYFHNVGSLAVSSTKRSFAQSAILQRQCIQLIQKSCFSSVKPLGVTPIQVDTEMP